MIWNSYGTPKEFGGINGMQSDVAPVSSGSAARLTRYFSAPGFNVGPAGAAAPRPPPRPPPPPKAYTPEKSGLPSDVRAMPLLTGTAGAAVAFGCVPSTT